MTTYEPELDRVVTEIFGGTMTQETFARRVATLLDIAALFIACSAMGVAEHMAEEGDDRDLQARIGAVIYAIETAIDKTLRERP